MKTLERVERQLNCSAHRYPPAKDHICDTAPQQNEVFYKKNDAKTPRQRQYINDNINVSFMCGAAHTRWGHTKEYTRWFYRQQCGRFGKMAVDNYFENWPGRVKTRIPE